MTLQTGKDPMISHPLSSVYGMYVLELDGEARFCTAEPEILFEQLGTISEKEASKVRVILLSSEQFEHDDITAFVWEAMVESYAKTTVCTSLADWDECVDLNIAFCRFGFDEFNPSAERTRRRATATTQLNQVASLVCADLMAPYLPMAAE